MWSNFAILEAFTTGWKINGAPTRTRTADLLITNQLLYQLSYRGTEGSFRERSRGCKRGNARFFRILHARRDGLFNAEIFKGKQSIMQLVLHTGVHFTEDERLLKCLLRNQDDFAKTGVKVPGPSTYRNLFRDTLNAMHKAEPSEVARDVLLDAILDDGTASRVILSDANFFRSPATALQEGVLYPAAAVRMLRMAQLFPKMRSASLWRSAIPPPSCRCFMRKRRIKPRRRSGGAGAGGPALVRDDRPAARGGAGDSHHPVVQ